MYSKSKGPVGPKGNPRRPGKFERRERKQLEAVERREERAFLSAQDQLKALDLRLGEGVGAKKERKRLLKKRNVNKKKTND